MNSLLNGLKEADNFDYTENGALAHKSTLSKVYDMFAFGGAYRSRNDEDVILLFKKAFEEDAELAMKCLFYLRDIRGGQGERRFFRVAFKWLCNNYPNVARKNLNLVSEYGRWDDLIYATEGTKVNDDMINIIKKQFLLDMDCKTPSLLGKWMPSENASAKETKIMANIIRKALGYTHKEYRKALSSLRKKINIVERLMSANKWDEIEFDKIPSRAGLIYKNAFARRDLIAKKYENFIKAASTTVNTKALYPYDVVAKATKYFGWFGRGSDISDVDRMAIEKYWNNLPDYLNGKDCSLMCVCDTSGSMHGTTAAAPINVAISLAMYCAERIGGDFKNHYISFSSRPQLIEIEGIDFVDKVKRIYATNLCENTNLEATFDLLKRMVLEGKAKKEDLPKTLVVISDMEIDEGTGSYWGTNSGRRWTEGNAQTEMERIRAEWSMAGLETPNLVYWNVQARQDRILDLGPNVSYVSGASPVLFEQILTGVTGTQLMLMKLNSERYKAIQI